MALITLQQQEAQQRVIRRLMNEEWKTDDEIMKELRISQSALYDYKNRIQQEDQKIWDLVHQDSSKFRAVQLLADLDKCRQECHKISSNYNYSPRDRMEALKTSCEASANIFKLLNEGLTFNVSIPNDKLKTYRVNASSEDKPKEDKDIEPVPDDPSLPYTANVGHDKNKKNEDIELIPSGHECWGLSTTRGYNHDNRTVQYAPGHEFSSKPTTKVKRKGIIKKTIDLSKC